MSENQDEDKLHTSVSSQQTNVTELTTASAQSTNSTNKKSLDLNSNSNSVAAASGDDSSGTKPRLSQKFNTILDRVSFGHGDVPPAILSLRISTQTKDTYQTQQTTDTFDSDGKTTVRLKPFPAISSLRTDFRSSTRYSDDYDVAKVEDRERNKALKNYLKTPQSQQHEEMGLPKPATAPSAAYIKEDTEVDYDALIEFQRTLHRINHEDRPAKEGMQRKRVVLFLAILLLFAIAATLGTLYGMDVFDSLDVDDENATGDPGNSFNSTPVTRPPTIIRINVTTGAPTSIPSLLTNQTSENPIQWPTGSPIYMTTEISPITRPTSSPSYVPTTLPTLYPSSERVTGN